MKMDDVRQRINNLLILFHYNNSYFPTNNAQRVVTIFTQKMA